MKPSTSPSANTALDENLAMQARPRIGSRVVLIHGLPLSVQTRVPQASTLRAADYHLVAHDRIGFGHSDRPESAFDRDTPTGELQHVTGRFTTAFFCATGVMQVTESQKGYSKCV